MVGDMGGDGHGALVTAIAAAAPPHGFLLDCESSNNNSSSLRLLALYIAQYFATPRLLEERKEALSKGPGPGGPLLLQGVLFSSLRHIACEDDGGTRRDSKRRNRGGVGGNNGRVEEATKGTLIPGLTDDAARLCLARAWRSSYGALSLASSSLRNLIKSGSIYEDRRRVGVVEQWVYMFSSGDSNWKAFDPRRRRWMVLPLCLADYTFFMSDKESLSAGTHLLWLGRELFGQVIFCYDLVSQSWERAAPMNSPRCLFASASAGPLAFVAGGNAGRAAVQSVECYNACTGTWEVLPDMLVPRQKASGCCLSDGRFVVIGGRDSNHRRIASAEVYNPSSHSWRLIPNMFPDPEGREVFESSPPLIAAVNDVIYCIDSSVNALKSYNWSTNAWQTIGPIPVRADASSGWGLAFKAVGDELFVIGGYRLPDEEGGHRGMAMFSWNPNPPTPQAPPIWIRVTFVEAPNDTFLSNCAVMAC